VIPIYIAAIAALMLASAVWRYRQRDMIGMAGRLNEVARRRSFYG
jgi:hypothetical protein